jgi:predicted Zn-dependent protease
MEAMSFQHRLLAASGYLDLGMWSEAAAELDALSVADRERPEAMSLRIDLHMAAKQWAEGAELSSRMVEREPHHSGWWINFAYCTRRSDSLHRAEQILLDAGERHPQEAMIFYNLACYASVGGRLAEARTRLDRAIALDSRVELLARDDEDLAPLRRAG